MERVTWKLTLPYVKQRANGNLLHDSGNSTRLCNTLEGRRRGQRGVRFKREGTYMYLWLIHVDGWQKPTKFRNAVILQLKNKFKKIFKSN